MTELFSLCGYFVTGDVLLRRELRRQRFGSRAVRFSWQSTHGRACKEGINAEARSKYGSCANPVHRTCVASAVDLSAGIAASASQSRSVAYYCSLKTFRCTFTTPVYHPPSNPLCPEGVALYPSRSSIAPSGSMPVRTVASFMTAMLVFCVPTTTDLIVASNR